VTFKYVLVLKRNPALTPEEFREGYETRIVPRAKRAFSHLWSDYRRRYVMSAQSFAASAGIELGADAPVFPFDAISEIGFKDKAAFEEQGRLSRQAENRAAINADEDYLFDRPNCWAVMCEVIDDDLSAPADG